MKHEIPHLFCEKIAKLKLDGACPVSTEILRNELLELAWFSVRFRYKHAAHTGLMELFSLFCLIKRDFNSSLFIIHYSLTFPS